MADAMSNSQATAELEMNLSENLRGKEVPPAKDALALEVAAAKCEEEEEEEEEEEAAKRVALLEPEEEEAPEDAAEEVAALNLDVLAVITAQLPSKQAYMCAVLSPSINQQIRGSLFFRRHLAPRPPFVDDVPNAFLLQPAVQESGYRHLCIVDPFHHNKKYNLAVRDDDGDDIELPIGDATPAPSFFKSTVRDINICLVASHGHLLLGRSPAAFFICCPEEDRWLKIPFPNNTTVVETAQKTAAGLWYEVDEASGDLRFKVVVLAQVSDTHVAVESFSSEEAIWVKTVVEEYEAAERLGVGVGPGICIAGAFFWKSRESGAVISFDASLSVIVEPPLAEGYPRRAESSLGSTGGRLRLCTFDVGSQEAYGFEVVALDGNFSVWVKEVGDAGWTQVKNIIVDVWWVYQVFRGYECPVDFAGASSNKIVVKKNRGVFLRDLDTGDLKFMTNVYLDVCPFTHVMYRSFYLFPAFM